MIVNWTRTVTGKEKKKKIPLTNFLHVHINNNLKKKLTKQIL